MTKFLQDILRQPSEMQRALDYLQGDGAATLVTAATAFGKARTRYVTGMGASWNAALAAAAYFHREGTSVSMLDASELLTAKIDSGAAVVILSRSGASAEIVTLLEKVREAGAISIGVTNFPDGALAQRADIPIIVPATPDHGISVGTYSTLALAATALAHSVTQTFTAVLAQELAQSLAALPEAMTLWREQMASTEWLAAGKPCYFLARGSSLASAHEAHLLWQEGAKTPATAMALDSFRHGPQEVITNELRVAIWVGEPTRDKDLALARDIRRLGAHVLVIGQELPVDSAEQVLQLPRTPTRWQFVTDVVPVQLAAERLASLSGADCDTFRFASYVVRSDTGLSLVS